MAYNDNANIAAMSNGQITSADYSGGNASIWSTWETWNDQRVDSILNRSFKLYKDTYKLTIDNSVYREPLIFLRTPLIPSGSVTGNSDISPKVFESDSDYPDPSSATALIKNTDYFVRDNHLERLEENNWKKFVTVVYHWGYMSVPTDIQYYANLLLLTFVLSTKSSSTSSGTTERIGDYQISTSSASTSSGSMDDEIREIKKVLLNKYSAPVFNNYYHQEPSPTLISSEDTVTVTV